MRQHNHELDSGLHEDCDECRRVLERMPDAFRDKALKAMSDRYAKIASRKPAKTNTKETTDADA